MRWPSGRLAAFARSLKALPTACWERGRELSRADGSTQAAPIHCVLPWRRRGTLIASWRSGVWRSSRILSSHSVQIIDGDSQVQREAMPR
jgi:hypothetical protein